MQRPERSGRYRWRVAFALVLAVIASGGAADPPSAPPPDLGKVAYAKISGPIDRLRHRYLERVIEEARVARIDTVVVHIDTDGGDVHSAREMFKLVLDQMQGGPRMIAYVDDRAISAGAMIAYAHEAIYMAEAASIGDIGIIFFSAEGEIKYAPEKIETVIRALLVQAAEQRGWSRGLLLKMTARQQELHRITLADGRQEYVIEDDLPDFLSRHPEVDREDEHQAILYRGKDRLLTLTGREASDLGMATGNAPSIEALWRQLGVEASQVLDLQPRPAETTAWYLSKIAPVLAGLALLFVLLELKTPGVGLWAGLAALCGAIFLFAQYYLDMAENIEVVLIALGVALVFAEVLTGVGGGFLAILGGLLAFAGLVLSFLPNEFDFDFGDERFVQALRDAALSSLVSVGVVAGGLIAFITGLPRLRIHRRFTVEEAITATSAGRLEASAASLVGRIGTAREALHPIGTVIVDGESYGARAMHGAYVTAGAEVEVVGVEFGELLVEGRRAG